MKNISAEIKCDKSLWERMYIPSAGKMLLVEESYYDGIIEDLEKQKIQLLEVIARNLVACDGGLEDKPEGLLSKIYLTNKYWYEHLTGEEYSQEEAVKKISIVEGMTDNQIE